MTKTHIALITLALSASLAGVSTLMNGHQLVSQQTMALLTGSDTIVMNEAAVEKMLSEPVMPPLVPIKDENKVSHTSVKVLKSTTSDSKIILDDVKRDFPEGHVLNLQPNRPVDLSKIIQTYIAARASEYAGNIPDAASFYEEAEQADPKNMWLKEKAFAMQLRVGNVATSVSIANDLQETEGVMPLVYLALLVDAVKTGDLKKALEFSEILVEKAPRVRDFSVIRTQLLLALGTPLEEALEAMGDSQLVDKDGVLAFFAAQWYQQAGQLEKAEAYYHLALGLRGQIRLYTLALLNLYQQSGQEEKAQTVIEAFKKAYHGKVGYTLSFVESTDLSTQFTADLKKNIVMSLYFLSQDIAQASIGVPSLQILNLALYLDPENDRSLFEKAAYFGREERYAEAKAVLENITPESMFYPRAQSQIAEALYEMGQLDASFMRLDKLIADYGYDDFYYQKGSMLFALNRHEEALSIYNILINRNQDSSAYIKARAYFSRGTVYEGMGLIDEADVDLKKALALQPANPNYQNFLGYMYVQHEINMDVAYTLISSAHKTAPENAAILDSLGWYWYKKGDVRRAVEYLSRAIVITPDEWEIYEHLAETYYKAGLVADAVGALSRALTFVDEADAETINRLEKRLKELRVQE